VSAFILGLLDVRQDIKGEVMRKSSEHLCVEGLTEKLKSVTILIRSDMVTLDRRMNERSPGTNRISGLRITQARGSKRK